MLSIQCRLSDIPGFLSSGDMVVSHLWLARAMIQVLANEFWVEALCVTSGPEQFNAPEYFPFVRMAEIPDGGCTLILGFGLTRMNINLRCLRPLRFEIVTAA